MKTINKLLPYFIVLTSFHSHAQVITDGSVGDIKHLSGNMVIPQNLGITAGNNLFHSFKSFDINQAESVTFTGSDNLKNVISRVTGGALSHINGLLKSDIKNANFYFINPAGIFFDKQAKVDVPAAFYMSTSNDVHFKDGAVFSTLKENISSLSIAQPTDFGFLNAQAGDIQIQSERYYIQPSYDNNFNEIAGYYIGDYLQFEHANKILFYANNIDINHGNLESYSGNITLQALNKLTVINDSMIDNSTNSAKNAGNMTLIAPYITIKSSKFLSDANINSSGNAGQVIIQAKELTVDGDNIHDNSFITNRTYSIGNAGILSINSNKVTIKNMAFLNNSIYGLGKGANFNLNAKELIIDSGIINNSSIYNIGGNAGNIRINSDIVTIIHNGQLSSRTYGTGNAGNIDVQAKILDISNDVTHKTGIFTSGANGKGGNITVNSDKILLNGTISSSATNGNGNAGNIVITSKELLIDSGNISSTTGSDAKAGNITIHSDKIAVNNLGVINTSTTGNGNAGNITIDQAKELTITNQGIIKSQTAFGLGNAGNINLNSENITVADGGKIDSTTDNSQGKAGNITLQAGNVNIFGKIIDNFGTPTFSQISSAALNNLSGQVGNIDINAQQAIHLYDGGRLTIQNDTSLNNPTAFNNGSIKLSSPDIDLNNALITTAATGNQDAGQINIAFSHELTLNNAQINSEAYQGNGGHLTIKGGELINLQNSIIETYTKAPSNDNVFKGGDIHIRANVLIMNTAQILSREAEKVGGFADLNLKALIPSHNQLQINGKTFGSFESLTTPFNIIRTADSGWITPQLNLNGSINNLTRTMLNVPNLSKSDCDNSLSRLNSLVRTSKGGIANKESHFINAPINLSHIKNLQSTITPELLAVNLTVNQNYSCIGL